MKLGGLVVVASNAGGAWTGAVGDVNRSNDKSEVERQVDPSSILNVSAGIPHGFSLINLRTYHEEIETPYKNI